MGGDPNAIVGDTYSIEEAREMVAPDSRLVFDELCSGAESVSIYIESLDVKENKIQRSDKLWQILFPMTILLWVIILLW